MIQKPMTSQQMRRLEQEIDTEELWEVRVIVGQE
jgi:hypothetical protein